MALDLDTRNDFRTAAELAGLVEAIAHAPAGEQETNWVEWKSSLDLGTPAGKFAVAKCILGFANRAPGVAALHCRGAAYMIVGAEPQNVQGVPAMDHATLSQKLATYLDDGPRWTAHDVVHDSKNVLVILVEPPREGDRIHSLKKALDSATQGTVYQRRNAQSEPASYAAMQMLQDRLLGSNGSDPEFDLELDVEAETLWRVNFGEDDVSSWLAKRRAYIMANTSKPPIDPPDDGSFINRMFCQQPGDAEKFEENLAIHMRKCKMRLRWHVSGEIYASRYNKVRFTVRNGPRRSVTGVKLIVNIPAVAAIFDSRPSVEPMPEMPQWPSPLGVSVDPPHSLNIVATKGFSAVHGPGPTTPHVERKEHGFEVLFVLGDFAPGDSITTDPITVVAGAGTPNEIPIKLIGRAMTRAGELVIEETLPVGGVRWEIEDLVAVNPSDSR